MSEHGTSKRDPKGRRKTARTSQIARTELVWPGKYDERRRIVEPPRVSLPIQVLEVVSEPPAREGAIPDGWRNKLIWGDNLLVEASLLREFAGKIDLIYIDPPFATGATFDVSVAIGEHDDGAPRSRRTIEGRAYRDAWGKGTSAYATMIRQELVLLRELLSDRGSIYVHVDYRASAIVRLVCDEVFGERNLINEIIWQYKTGGMPEKLGFGRKHDNILFYAKHREKATWNPQKEKSYLMHKYGFSNVDVLTDANGHYTMVNCRDVFDIPALRGNQPEKLDYPTQKPQALLERLVLASSNPGDLVADFFCGSGTTLAVADQLNRRWIGCDLGRFAIHTTRKRLLGRCGKDGVRSQERGCSPFEVWSLGRHERRYWYETRFRSERAVGEQAARATYVEFIAHLYGAEPEGGPRLHGRKGHARLFVGGPDEAVTRTQVEGALIETVRSDGKELHVLGWEFERELRGPIAGELAVRHHVALRLISIPREAMESHRAPDMPFLDLPQIDVDVKHESNDDGGRAIRVVLRSFAIPFLDLIPGVCGKISEWSDLVDYWAVDWDFRGGPFTNAWRAYRTRQDRSLVLETPTHVYPQSGTYQILVRVVDVFGQDTDWLVRYEVP